MARRSDASAVPFVTREDFLLIAFWVTACYTDDAIWGIRQVEWPADKRARGSPVRVRRCPATVSWQGSLSVGVYCW